MKVKRQDIFSPANFVTLAGLILTTIGAFRFNTVAGFNIVLIGKIFDLLDGIIARRTHISPLGAEVDATADKVSGLIVLISAYHFRLAPVAFLLFLFFQHLIVAIISVLATLRGIAMSVTVLGKHNMFIHITTLLVFAASKLVRGSMQDGLQAIAFALAIFSVVYGVAATYSYIRQVFKISISR